MRNQGLFLLKIIQTLNINYQPTKKQPLYQGLFFILYTIKGYAL